MPVHKPSECLTEEQLTEWKKSGDKRNLEKAAQQAEGCVFCKRVWMKFWADR